MMPHFSARRERKSSAPDKLNRVSVLSHARSARFLVSYSHSNACWGAQRLQGYCLIPIRHELATCRSIVCWKLALGNSHKIRLSTMLRAGSFAKCLLAGRDCATPRRRARSACSRASGAKRAYSFRRSQTSRPRARSRAMTISQCRKHNSICRTCRPAPSTFSAMKAARSWHRNFLHLESYPHR